ncbi:MAG: c-type cytochrome [Gemmatimonadetes bacterium]|nr:c-type cytochrome [Gemmatimonadota bacterium]
MRGTNLKIALIVLLTVGFYTLVANVIPQVESEVPRELTLGPGVTPEELVAAGEGVYHGPGGCEVCHGLGTRAPRLLTAEGALGLIGARCGLRVGGQDCKAYLYESLVKPQAYLVAGYEPIMPDMSRQLSPAQIWAVVAFLQAQGGEVTVTTDDLGGALAPGAAAGGAPAAGAAAPLSATMDPIEIMRGLGCFACHVFRGEGGPIGPELMKIGAARNVEYLRESILKPDATIAAGFERFAGLMPKDFGQKMTAAQLDTLVHFLANQR